MDNFGGAVILPDTRSIYLGRKERNPVTSVFLIRSPKVSTRPSASSYASKCGKDCFIFMSLVS